mgnify:CR=1 FL=1
MPSTEGTRAVAGAGLSRGKAVREAAEALAGSSSSPRLDAELLLTDLLGIPYSHLFAYPERCLAPGQAAAFRERIARRAAGEPAAYILGYCGFRGLDLAVTPAVLVPRPETEHVVEQAIARLPHGGKLLDPGTGCGAIALAVAAERPDARVTATERCPEARAVAAENRDRLGLAGRVALHACDWADGLPEGPFDVIAGNPPYVETGAPEWADGALAHEPEAALAAGTDGLAAIRSLLPPAVAALARGSGTLILEHGAAQGPAVRRLLAASGLTGVATGHDLSGQERVSHGRRP